MSTLKDEVPGILPNISVLSNYFQYSYTFFIIKVATVKPFMTMVLIVSMAIT